jgi:hypothetical protein
LQPTQTHPCQPPKPILATTILHQPPQANKTQSQIQQKLPNPPPAITNSKSQTQKQIHKPQKNKAKPTTSARTNPQNLKKSSKTHTQI